HGSIGEENKGQPRSFASGCERSAAARGGRVGITTDAPPSASAEVPGGWPANPLDVRTLNYFNRSIPMPPLVQAKPQVQRRTFIVCRGSGACLSGGSPQMSCYRVTAQF